MSELIHRLQHNRKALVAAILLFLVLGTAAAVLIREVYAVSLRDCSVTVEPTDCDYTGKAVRPKVVITHDKDTLKKGKDYVLRYRSNKNPGKAHVVIAGIGEYTGVVSPSFRIHVDPAKNLKADVKGDKKNEKNSVIHLTWEPSSCCDHYEITAARKLDKSEPKKYTTEDTAFDFKDVDGFGEYDFAVTAVAGPSKTLSAPADATAVINPLKQPVIQASSPGAGHIDVTWEPVAEAQGYVVTEKCESNGETDSVTVPADQTAASFLRRDKGNSYTYTMHAIATIDGQSYESPESEGVTTSPASPRMGQAIGGENGHTGNKAGDQKGGHEMATGKWSYSSKNHAWNNWKYVARFKDPQKAAIAAQAMKDACANDHIGYDQKPGGGRGELKKLAEAANWDMSAITTNCEASCSPLVGACVNCAGIDLPAPGSTGNSDFLRPLERTGEFDIITDKDYTSSDKNLMEGDILVSPGRHTGMVL